jgi:hypothetical protein
MSETAKVKTAQPPEPADLLERIERITALLEVALAPQLEAGRESLRRDPIDGAIFDHTAGNWVLTGELQASVTKATKAKDRTIRDRIGGLVERGLLQKRGGARNIEYRSAGVV